MAKIESAGTYVGTITEAQYGETKNGLPQAVVRLQAEKRYIEDKETIEWYQTNQKVLLDGKPGYVDYAANDENIVGFLVLFSAKNDKPTLHAEQLFKATGWQFPSFDQLGELVGKQVMFQVKEKKGYTDQAGVFHDQAGELEVSWIDSADASPERSLKAVDPDAVKAAMAKYKQFAPKPVAKAAAKPVGPVAPSAVAPSPSTSAAALATPTTTTASPSKAPPKRAKMNPIPNGKPVGVADECSQIDAWNFVNANKADADDNTVAEVWSKVTGEVLGDLPEESATPAHWARVRDQVTAKLAALVPA